MIFEQNFENQAIVTFFDNYIIMYMIIFKFTYFYISVRTMSVMVMTTSVIIVKPLCFIYNDCYSWKLQYMKQIIEI